MYSDLIRLALALVNYVNARAANDPHVAGKIQRGEPLDLDDFLRLGIDRDAAGGELNQAIEDTAGD